MARTNVKELVAARHTTNKVSKFDFKKGWYYISMEEKGEVSVVATADDNIDAVIKRLFGNIVPRKTPVLLKDIYLLSQEPAKDKVSEPLLYYKNSPQYGKVLFCCLLDENSIVNAQPLPFNLAINCLEAVNFGKNSLPSVEVSPLYK